MKRLAWIGLCGVATMGLVSSGCGDSATDGGGSGGTGNTVSTGATTKSSSSAQTTSSNTTTATTDTSASSSDASSSSTGLENCTAVTWAYTKSVTNAFGAAIRGILSPNFGEPQNDLLEFDFYDGATGVIDLAAGTNPDWNTCTQCAWAQQDAAGTVVNYMPLSGTMTIAAGSTPMTGDITFEVTDVTLIEVTIDEVAMTTTPVPDGRCLTLAMAGGTFTAP